MHAICQPTEPKLGEQFRCDRLRIARCEGVFAEPDEVAGGQQATPAQQKPISNVDPEPRPGLVMAKRGCLAYGNYVLLRGVIEEQRGVR